LSIKSKHLGSLLRASLKVDSDTHMRVK